MKDIQTIICIDKFPKSISNDAPCEIVVLVERNIPNNCDKLLTKIEDYNVQKLTSNKWLPIIAQELPITVFCPSKQSTTEIVKNNSILTLDPLCNSFIGTTRVYATPKKNNEIQTHHIISEIDFDCCEHVPEESKLPILEPIKINHMNLDELKQLTKNSVSSTKN